MYWSSEMPQCQQKTGWAFFFWLVLLFGLKDTARTNPPPRDPATLLPRFTLIATLCGLGSASQTVPSICKAFHLQCEQASHLPCTAPSLTLTVYHYFLSPIRVFPKVKIIALDLSACSVCFSTFPSLFRYWLFALKFGSSFLQPSCSDSLPSPSLLCPPSW